MSSDPSTKEPARPAKMVPLGKYEVISHIATGGMGTVYRARDKETGLIVALKVLNKQSAQKPEHLERFHREARNSIQLRHENIVAVFETGQHKDIVYIAMEFVEGIDLADHIHKKGRLDPDEAREITFQATRALLHAHKRDIVHRDIKPSNFLLCWPDGKVLVKLTDLGLSRQISDEEFRVTREGFTVGTVDYISPEQARDSGLADIRSDIYSLGCTLYHMLTGQPPFPEGGLGERIYKHMEVEPTDVRELNPDVPAGLAQIVHRMLAKKPEDRYQTPRDLLQALTMVEKYPEGPSRQKKPASDVVRPRLKKAEKTPAEIDTPAQETKEIKAPRTKEKKPASDEKKSHGKPRKKAASSDSRVWLLVAGAGSMLLIGLIVIFLRPWGKSNSEEENPDGPKPDPIVNPNPPKPSDRVDPGPKDGKPTDKPPVQPPPVVWPPLRADGASVDKDKLTKLYTEGWGEQAVSQDVPVFRVRRSPNNPAEYGSIADAAKAIQEKGGLSKPGMERVADAVIEIEDNGPLYETSFALTAKSVILRAAPGYQPLIFWSTEREKEKPLPPFASVQDGNLILEGLEFALQSSRPVSEVRSAFARVTRGDFTARRCVFSVAGSHPAGVAIARLEGGKQDRSVRGRLSRCYGRGTSLIGFDLDGSTRDILLDDTLLIADQGPLLDSQLQTGNRLRLQVLRSTLVDRGTCLRFRAEEPTKLPPSTLEFRFWDSLFTRFGSGREGTFLDLPVGVPVEAIRRQAHNTLYRGWKTLQQGSVEISGSDVFSWEKSGASFGGERVENASWPAIAFSELAIAPSLELSTSRVPGDPVGFASTSWPCLAPSDSLTTSPPTIGCPIALLPPARDRWLQWTTQRFITPPVEVLNTQTPPEIPNPGGTQYHGERLDLTRADLGAHLDRVQRMRGFGPRIVMHLFRSAEEKVLPTGSIRVRNAHVVLHLESLKRLGTDGKDPTIERLILQSNGENQNNRPALIEIENGSLDIIGGEIRAEDYAHLIKVKNGSLRLHDVYLTGPLLGAPGHFEGLALVQSGETVPVVTLNESVLASGRGGLRVQGMARVRVVESAIVAGTDAIELEPGSQKRPKLSLSCALETSTITAGHAAIRIGNVTFSGLLEEPLLIQSRNCAFLNPFGEKAGLLLTEGDALQRGLILWQGEQDCFDKRLHYMASTSTVPEQQDQPETWSALWGPSGSRRTILAHPATNRFELDRWPLERLAITPPPLSVVGADLIKLGLVRKPTRPK